MLPDEVIDRKVEVVTQRSPYSFPLYALKWDADVKNNKMVFTLVVSFGNDWESFTMVSQEDIQKDDFHRKLSEQYESFVRELWQDKIVDETTAWEE